MKIKRIKKLRVNCYIFKVVWDSELNGASFNYIEKIIIIGTKQNNMILSNILHELMEIVTIEMGVRLSRPDCDCDHIFVYDHRQHTTMMEMLSGLLLQFTNEETEA